VAIRAFPRVVVVWWMPHWSFRVML